ncbi:hypothetical protein CVS40_6558 [Lucilia cuprina]|nr:hypothetical protein CVS40_6558 [Lucilia cuprina]
MYAMEKSFVWNYFSKGTKSDAQCNLCPKILSYKGSSTSGLVKHLTKIHHLDQKSENKNIDAEDSPPIKRQRNIDDYVKSDDLNVTLAKLAAFDGISIRTITRSSFIRESLARKGFTVPKCETTIMKCILNYFEQINKDMIASINNIVKNNGRFSLVLDEWTSLKNKRYLNINLYGPNNKLFNLGMINIEGKCGALELRKMVETKLDEYNLSLKEHIVSTISDGPNVMKKFISESPACGILCLNHCIHLAILEVLYQKKNNKAECSSSSNESDTDNFDESDENNSYNLIETYSIVLNNMRKIIKCIKRSPLKNGTLQTYVKAEFGKELQLSLDIKTRWNSLLAMMDSFLKIKNCIKKTLIDYNLAYMWDDNFDNLESLYNVLYPKLGLKYP